MQVFDEKLWSKEIFSCFMDFVNKPAYWVPVFDPKKDPAVIAAKKMLDAIQDKESPEYKTAKILYDAALKAADSSNLLTQDKVNSLIAEEKRKAQESHQATLDELKALQKQANLTSEERATLEQKIQDIQSTLQTKEQTAAENAAKAEKRHQKEVEDLTTRKDKWKNLYTSSTINGAIRDACEVDGQKAHSSRHVLAILAPDTQLVEDLDKDGKPTGELIPKVTFKDKDDKGKPITLYLSPAEAVKRMSDMKEHMNLFVGKGKGGPGLNRDQVDTSNIAEIAKDPAAYRAGRKDGSITL